MKVITPLAMCAISMAAQLAASNDAAAQLAADFMLVRHDLQMQPVTLLELTPTRVTFLDDESKSITISVDACIALFKPDAKMPDHDDRVTGLLTLADGQSFAGQATSSGEQSGEVFVWNSVVGRLDVPLSRIASIAFTADAVPVETRDTDVVVLANGDRVDGFLVSVSDPIVIEQELKDGEVNLIELPRDGVRSITMVTPPAKGKGRRIWVSDGSIMDVASINVARESTSRSVTVRLIDGETSGKLRLSQVRGISFAPNRLTALASLKPSEITGPSIRYFVPEPRTSAPAPLGLSSIELSGPILVRYALNGQPRQFAAEAVLPQVAHRWGDVVLTVRDDDTEVFRATLNAESPRAMIAVRLRGSELTIELEEGANGPIQDRIILNQAILFADE